MKLPFSKKYHKLPPTEKLAVVEGLSIMLSAGIPILEAIEALKEDTENKNTKLVLAGLSDEISSGKTLSDAISAFSDSFDLVFINIIKSGEASGNLDKVLTHLAENIKSSIETSDNIKSALFYPALVIVTLVSVSFYMFAFSLPKISTVFIDLNIDLPAYSTFIFKFSLFFQKNLLYIGAGFLTSIILSIWLLRTTKIRKIFFSFLIKLPSVRTLIKYMDLSRFTKTTALLLTAGVPIIDVLDISKNVIISPKLNADIEDLKDSLTEGINLADAMKTRPKRSEERRVGKEC